ncbi:MAG: hypothetical protein QOJ51_1272, partial [Acidobacteriaceae bacterium]|nr:hypothetical protein [Acidobacteriaceae bacterium]
QEKTRDEILNHAIQLISQYPGGEVWAVGDTAGGRFERHGEAERATPKQNALQTKGRCVEQEQFKRQDKPSKREEHR